MNLCDYNTIRDLLARHGFHFSKSMGQNFLIDPEVPRRIAEASGADAGCGVLEIGPGIGPLTAVVPGDVLKLDLTAIAAEKFQGLTPIVCANLPYNVTSPILEKLVESPCFTAFTVMIQREVAQRLCAPQGSSEGGSFSLFLQYYMKPELLFDVPPEKFLPAPKVTSAVIRPRWMTRPTSFGWSGPPSPSAERPWPTASPPPCRGFPRNPSNRPSPIWACLPPSGGNS